MWNIKNFFCVLLLAVSTNAANLICYFDGSPTSSCQSFTLSQVTQVNEDISVPNAPFTPYTDSMTTSLNLSPENRFIIREFPRKLFGIFTNIYDFYASGIYATELIADSFYNCNHLNTINFEGSPIGIIRSRFASTCYFVNTIYFHACQIESIEEDAFEGLLTLSTLYMYYNALTCIPPKLFHPLKNLQMLDMSGNRIKALHSQAFVGLTKLYNIQFGNNQIGYIPNLNLNSTGTDNYDQQLHIELNENPIRAIHPLFMTNLYSGRFRQSYSTLYIYFYLSEPSFRTSCINPHYLELNPSDYPGDLYTIGQDPAEWIRQNITYQHSTTCYSDFTAEMGSDSLVNCGSVLTTTTTVSPGGSTTPGGSGSGGGQCATDKICRYYLDWSNTYTCVIDGAEGTVTSISGAHYLSFIDSDVARVYFTNSNLNLVPNILFQKFINLKYLHIANAGLSVINDQTFNECGNLELLDASNNNIIHVDETALRNCTKLRVIDLTGNQINYVSGGLYQLDPALERVHLTRLDDWILA